MPRRYQSTLASSPGVVAGAVATVFAVVGFDDDEPLSTPPSPSSRSPGQAHGAAESRTWTHHLPDDMCGTRDACRTDGA